MNRVKKVALVTCASNCERYGIFQRIVMNKIAAGRQIGQMMRRTPRPLRQCL